VVKDDFPDYEGILEIDFLQKQQAMCDHGKKRLRIGDETLKLQSYSKLILKPRSETIIQAITSSKRVGIVKAEETDIFIGNCLVKPEKGTCPISVINIMDEQVVTSMPLVTIEELPEDVTPDTAEKQMMQITQRKGKEPMQAYARKERLKKSRTEHLNKEEKEALEQICEEFCNTFYLEDNVLTCTSTVTHEINTRTDSAPVNVRPYRLPEKHKKEVSRQN